MKQNESASRLNVRKTHVVVEEWYQEARTELDRPLKFVIAAAVLENPWHTDQPDEDLKQTIEEFAPQLASILVPLIEAETGGSEFVEAIGKGSIVGLDGEMEHAAALIHTLHFGNPFRRMVEGESYISSTSTRGSAGTALAIPMIHKNDRGRRTHFLSTDLIIQDAPRANEIVVAICTASGGRPFARIGDRKIDLATGVGQE